MLKAKAAGYNFFIMRCGVYISPEDGEKFEAQTYCFNMEEGDAVIFLEGSAFGACASAVILNLRTREKCAVWC